MRGLRRHTQDSAGSSADCHPPSRNWLRTHSLDIFEMEEWRLELFSFEFEVAACCRKIAWTMVFDRKIRSNK